MSEGENEHFKVDLNTISQWQLLHNGINTIDMAMWVDSIYCYSFFESQTAIGQRTTEAAEYFKSHCVYKRGSY